MISGLSRKRRPFLRAAIPGIMLFVIVSVFGLITFVIDPFGLFGVANLPGINLIKTEQYSRARQLKPLRISILKPATLILGSSKAGALNPNFEGWKYRPVYNATMPRASLFEIRSLAEHAYYSGGEKRLKQIVIVVSFDMFEKGQRFHAYGRGFDESRLLTEQSVSAGFKQLDNIVVRSLYGSDLLVASWNTVKNQPEDSIPISRVYDENGHLLLNKGRVASMDKITQPKLFRAIESALVRLDFSQNNVPESGGNHIVSKDGKYDPFRNYERLLQFFGERDVEVITMICPAHARLRELIRQTGKTENYEQWILRMTEINELISRSSGGEMVLWDFADYSSPNLEPLRDAENGYDLRYHWEPAHVTTLFGHLMMTRMLTGVGDFSEPIGRILTKDTVFEAIQSDRIESKKWRAENKQTVDELREAIEEYKAGGQLENVIPEEL